MCGLANTHIKIIRLFLPLLITIGALAISLCLNHIVLSAAVVEDGEVTGLDVEIKKTPRNWSAIVLEPKLQSTVTSSNNSGENSFSGGTSYSGGYSGTSGTSSGGSSGSGSWDSGGGTSGNGFSGSGSWDSGGGASGNGFSGSGSWD